MSTPNLHHGQNAAVLLSRLRLLVVAGLGVAFLWPSAHPAELLTRVAN